MLKDQNIIDEAVETLNKAMINIGYNIANTTIEVENQIYDGKKQRPEVVVKDGEKILEEGVDYTVSYSNNKQIGTSTVTVKGCNSYFGIVKAEFSILPEIVDNLKVSQVITNSLKLSWSKVDDADGYKIYMETLKQGKYTLVKYTSSTKITKTELDSKKGYYFKVRAYKIVDNKKIYSSYSTIKYIKIK